MPIPGSPIPAYDRATDRGARFAIDDTAGGGATPIAAGDSGSAPDTLARAATTRSAGGATGGETASAVPLPAVSEMGSAGTEPAVLPPDAVLAGAGQAVPGALTLAAALARVWSAAVAATGAAGATVGASDTDAGGARLAASIPPSSVTARVSPPSWPPSSRPSRPPTSGRRRTRSSPP